MSVSNCRALTLIRSSCCRWASFTSPAIPSASNSSYPMIAVSGVRSSWLIVARKFAFDSFATTAAWYSCALSIATAARRARSRANASDPWSNGRVGVVLTIVNAPTMCPRAIIGMIIAERNVTREWPQDAPGCGLAPRGTHRSRRV